MDTELNIDDISRFFLTVPRGKIYARAIEDLEKRLIEKALEISFGNQVIAAKMLGLNRNTLRTKIRKFNICTENFKKL